MEMKLSRRTFLLSTLAGGAAAAGYGCYIEPNRLERSRFDIQLDKRPLTAPIKVLHLSDFHLSDVVPLSLIERAVAMGLAENPQLICFTGDLVTGKDLKNEQYTSVLKRLSAHAPCYAVPGNHDGGLWTKQVGGFSTLKPVAELLDASGITLLHNSSAEIEVSGQRLLVVGLGDIWSGDADSVKAFQDISADADIPRILLSHNPDSKSEVADYDWDLMLCGHTHGGQLRIPGLGAPFAPVRDPRYVEGLNEWKGRLIYTTRGVGNLYGIRINCPPEVSVLTLA